MQVIDLGAWTPYLEQELRAPYFAALLQRVGAARAAGTVYPPEERTFFALTATPPERVRAVILGQDPYHEPGQAMGLAFSVPQGERLPPSLRNIFTELHTDLGLPQPFGGDLTPWAERGVLLLNTVLTVGRGAANSHAAWGWQRFTDAVLAAMAALPQPVAFVLWGGHAQKKAAIAADSPWAEKRIAEFSPSGGELVILILRNSKTVIPKGDTRIKAGDVLVIASQEEALIQA